MQLIKDSIDLSDFMNEGVVDHAVNPASTWIQQVKDHFYAPQEKPLTRLPWAKTYNDFQFREGEVTLWAGINGHGKSMIVSEVCLSLAKQNERVCMASLEMKPYKTMARMSRQAFGHSEPALNYLDMFSDWTDGKLWIYDHTGSCKPATMLAVIRYAVDKFRITHFVVDNLMKVVEGEDKYNDQKDFVAGLCTIAHDTGVHIHLVLHVKKGKSEADKPNKFDIKGTGAITDLVDNVFIVWRNKPKEENMRTGDQSLYSDFDAYLNLVKQRNGETEGVYGLFFDTQSMQYLENSSDHPAHFKIEKHVYENEVEF